MISGRGHGVGNPLPAAKPLKTLKTAMGSYWKKLAWIWVWRHSRLGLAPYRLGAGAAPPWGCPAACRRAAPPELASPALLRHD
jgi:hypothetical protein